MSTTMTALTCHLVMPAGHPGDAFLTDTSHMLKSNAHATFQIEVSESAKCELEPDDVV